MENPMSKHIYLPAFVVLALLGAQAWADDTVSRATPTRHQLMKECIDKQKTADVTMSKSEMQRICKDELKRQKDFGVATPPPDDPPRER
jgi:hypothetical protein